MAQISNIFDNLYFLTTCSVAVTLLISFRLYPIIIYVVNRKGLMDDPDERSAHTNKVPTLGGMGLFIVFSLTVMLLGVLADLSRPELLQLVSLLAGTLLLLIMGVKDDLVLMSPKKKLIGQLLAASMVIFLSDVRIAHFQGLLGIGELPYWVSIFFTFFVFILVINAVNLIDGIDGLAGSIAVLSSVTFGIFFLLNEQYLLSLISFALIGSLIGFLYYNLSNTQKLFMGDSGSLLIGFLLAYQGVVFLGVNENALAALAIPNAPILLLAVLSYPLLDTLRVFSIRIWQKRSPFSADRNHIHHRLLDLGNAHEQATLIVCVCNIFIISLVLFIDDLNINLQLIISVLVGSALYLIPFLKVFQKKAFYLPEKTKSNSILGGGIKNTLEDQKLNSNTPETSGVVQLENSARDKEPTPLDLSVPNPYLSEIKDFERQSMVSKRLSDFKKVTTTDLKKVGRSLRKQS
ncbi:MraY family glycosyltransferase [Ulvibacterium marinum]|uniref:Undecaprenyl/decaprenyl-phosphate alpha-N-acetylglucosaminyl 1-phosphate transferase n=1 Tax=Ulvibacterium marinum TaxID=2419782 RepID=A0A3B0C586_9FLAO|nr:MraY family glycosyltransferase [Ulvibacterium marinum]RKN79758.1 undecaprenyl/decaprenyl-phosphate alpha-N-acetylglucosaminyl 1-phosphate transferase [Ulvibacterium marinum]